MKDIIIPEYVDECIRGTIADGNEEKLMFVTWMIENCRAHPMEMAQKAAEWIGANRSLYYLAVTQGYMVEPDKNESPDNPTGQFVAGDVLNFTQVDLGQSDAEYDRILQETAAVTIQVLNESVAVGQDPDLDPISGEKSEKIASPTVGESTQPSETGSPVEKPTKKSQKSVKNGKTD